MKKTEKNEIMETFNSELFLNDLKEDLDKEMIQKLKETDEYKEISTLNEKKLCNLCSIFEIKKESTNVVVKNSKIWVSWILQVFLKLIR
jgi:hypothetical protein